MLAAWPPIQRLQKRSFKNSTVSSPAVALVGQTATGEARVLLSPVRLRLHRVIGGTCWVPGLLQDHSRRVPGHLSHNR